MDKTNSWNSLHRLRRWLAPEDSFAPADLIFVLAGRQERKLCGLHLFKEGHVARLLLSVARYELRRFGKLDLQVPPDLIGLAANIPPPERHFFVYLSGNQPEVTRIPLGLFGTMDEIVGLASWLRIHPEIGSLLVLSSGSHLRRVRLCCSAILPSPLRVYMVSASQSASRSGEIGVQAGRESAVETLTELAKFCVYRIVLWLRASRFRRA